MGQLAIGYMRQEHYVLKHNWVEEMMRKVDPDIDSSVIWQRLVGRAASPLL